MFLPVVEAANCQAYFYLDSRGGLIVLNMTFKISEGHNGKG